MADSPQAALSDAVAVIGSQSAFAKLIGLTQPAISAMLSDKRVLAAEHVLTVERATGVPKERLRPDLYPKAEPGLEPAR